MGGAADAPPCDGCDTMLVKAYLPSWDERRRRFLDAYRQGPTLARAARLAGVARCSVYRWQADPAFAAAMKAAADAFFDEHRAKVLAAEAARREWRQSRERARRAQRLATLAENVWWGHPR